MKGRGFSLVETLIALALLMMLIPIGLTMYSSYRVQTELAQRVRRLDLLWSVLEHDRLSEGETHVQLTGEEERAATIKEGERFTGIISLRRHRRGESRR